LKGLGSTFNSVFHIHYFNIIFISITASLDSYRPISLTQSIRKLKERLVTDRLTWFLESNNLLSSIQSGFRRSRSVIDHIDTLCDKITKAKANKQHTLGIFLDFEKAFDLVWHKGLMIKLKNLGVQGRFFA
jgi:hypothetical protein